MTYYFDNERALGAIPLSAPYAHRAKLSQKMEESYNSIYQLLGADQDRDQLVITSSGAESVNHITFSTYLDVTRKSGKNHFISSTLDEAPAVMSMTRLRELGCVYEMAKVNEEGVVTQEILAETITPRTALVSLSWANGLTGVIQPLEEIAALCVERGIILHIDATHVLGKGFFPLVGDYITFDGEPLGAPAGSGALLIRRSPSFSSLIVGGEMQGGLRGGSLNPSLLFSLGEAAAKREQERDHITMETARLRDHFETCILESDIGVFSPFKKSHRLPNVSLLTFEGVSSEALLCALSHKGLYANMGGGLFQQIRMHLLACGFDQTLSHTALSFAFSEKTSEEEIDKGAALLIETVRQLRLFSKELV